MSGVTTTSRIAGVTGGYPTPTDFTSQPRYVDDVFDVMSPYEVPFLKLIGNINSFEATNNKVEWQTDDLWNGQLTLSATTGFTDTSQTTLYLNASQAYMLQVGTVIQIGDEMMWVASITSATVAQVTRGYAGSTLAIQATNLTVYLAGVAVPENADSNYIGTSIYSYPYNWTQAFDSAIQSSLMNENTEYYGKNPAMDSLIETHTKRLISMMEVAVLRGIRGVAGDMSATEPSAMGGLAQYINSTDSNVTDVSAALTEKNLNDLLQTIFYRVGEANMAKTIICGSWVKRKISGFYAAYNRMNQGTTEGGVAIDTIQTDFGKVDVLMMLRCPPERLYLINPKFIEVGHYKGLNFAVRDLAIAGPYVRKHIYGVYTAKVKNVEAMGLLDNITLTS